MLLGPEDLYNKLVEKIEVNPKDPQIVACMMSELKALQKTTTKVWEADENDADSNDHNDSDNENECQILTESVTIEVLNEPNSFDKQFIERNPFMRIDTMKSILEYIWKTATIDITRDEATENLILISYIYETCRGVGAYIGNGTGNLTLSISALTNYFMIGLEVSISQ